MGALFGISLLWCLCLDLLPLFHRSWVEFSFLWRWSGCVPQGVPGGAPAAILIVPILRLRPSLRHGDFGMLKQKYSGKSGQASVTIRNALAHLIMLWCCGELGADQKW